MVRIAAALITNPERRMLLVRKRGTEAFMQPGGKIEPGESAGEALSRELFEELLIDVEAEGHIYLGRHRAVAANEPGHDVEAELFAVGVSGPIRTAAEIDGAVWVDPAEAAGLPLAPLTRDRVLPIARRLGFTGCRP
ncbi:NUDIX hydrolase [Enterovirga rhinocerotis]|uniref:ADP-ribose pyrophosphatase YjhB (NUDIX family) n=1 Tax=Enterovirga rhinocerotis TaxID=1339210 RepID=A0A4R7BJZ7_9HYPH|nr:NUDIX domain-containing protein [Enterovirga rhinocerotis]TDR85343.1 ADP-ribose pyrophosphatase YjhB (NUDIX family) [Enterovirga rhinocerotis]